MAAATTTTLSNILKQVYLPAVVQQLNSDSIFLKLLLGPTLEEAIELGAGKLMATATLSTLHSILNDFFAPAVRGHKLKDVQVHRRPDADMITMSCWCAECKQVYAQNVSMPALYAAKGDLDGIKHFLDHTIKSFFEYIEDQPCCGKDMIPVIAEWLTEKLAEYEAMSIQFAEELWKADDYNWSRDVVEEVARAMSFLDAPELKVETLLPPTDELEPIQIKVESPGKLKLPKEHPLAA